MMAGTHRETLPVSVIGANDRLRDTIDLFFKGPCAGRYILCHEQAAIIAIADLDAVGGRDLLERHLHRYPHRPVIALTVRDLDIDGVRVLRKPIQMKLLEEAIEACRDGLPAPSDQQAAPALEPLDNEPTGFRQAKPASEHTLPAVASRDEQVPTYLPPEAFLTHLQPRASVLPQGVGRPSTAQAPGGGAKPIPPATGSRTEDRESVIQICCGSSPDADPKNPKEHDRLFYRPTTFLQGYVERAMKDGRRRSAGVRLALGGGRTMTILPRAAIVLTDMSDWVLRPCAAFSTQDDEVQVAYFEVDEERLLQQTELPACSYESFLWKVALWAARGRVPVGIELTCGVELLRWPNFTRLLAIPSFLRISALWSQGAYSLFDTASILGIPQRHVFALFSACHALGITQIGDTMSPLQKLSATSEIQQRRLLLSRIAHHLQRI